MCEDWSGAIGAQNAEHDAILQRRLAANRAAQTAAAQPATSYPLSDLDRSAIYGHLTVAAGAINEAKSQLVTAQERLDKIADVMNKMVPVVR